VPPQHPKVAPPLPVGVTVPTPVPSGNRAPCVGRWGERRGLAARGGESAEHPGVQGPRRGRTTSRQRQAHGAAGLVPRAPARPRDAPAPRARASPDPLAEPPQSRRVPASPRHADPAAERQFFRDAIKKVCVNNDFLRAPGETSAPPGKINDPAAGSTGNSGLERCHGA